MLLIPIRYPSGADLATCAKPNSPEAPGLLLTTTGTPSRLDRCSASVRAVGAVPPPAADPATRSIGFLRRAGAGAAGGPREMGRGGKGPCGGCRSKGGRPNQTPNQTYVAPFLGCVVCVRPVLM